jgi:hypothetical protein
MSSTRHDAEPASLGIVGDALSPAILGVVLLPLPPLRRSNPAGAAPPMLRRLLAAALLGAAAAHG